MNGGRARARRREWLPVPSASLTWPIRSGERFCSASEAHRWLDGRRCAMCGAAK